MKVTASNGTRQTEIEAKSCYTENGLIVVHTKTGDARIEGELSIASDGVRVLVRRVAVDWGTGLHNL